MSIPARPSLVGRLLATPPPSAAIAIDARWVTAVSVASQAKRLVISGHVAEGLAAGVVTPALNGVNVHDGPALADAIRRALDRLAPRPRRVALVLPDVVGKVSLVRFDKVPARAPDLEQLIRWQVRKTAPFRIEDAQVAWAPGVALADGGREFIVTTARRDIIESYERACEAAGAHAGLVDLASLNLVNAVLAAGGDSSGSGDWLLVHITPEDGTLAVVRGADLIFFRHRPAAADDELIAIVHQTAMYHEDRLGGGAFARVILAGASSRSPEAIERLRHHLEERAGARVEPLDFRGAVALRDRISAGPELLDSLGAPLGLILRERVA